MKARKLLSLALSITLSLSIFLGPAQAFAEDGIADNNGEPIIADQGEKLENSDQPTEEGQPEVVSTGAEGSSGSVCTCTAKCSQDGVNGDCPVCTADYGKCAYIQPQCICSSLCTAESINSECPVCSASGEDMSGCLGESTEDPPAESHQEKLCAQLPDCTDGRHGEGCTLYATEGEKSCAQLPDCANGQHGKDCPLYIPEEPKGCTLTENCILEAGHQGECVTAEVLEDPAEAEHEAEYETAQGVWNKGSFIQAIEEVCSGGKIKLLKDISLGGSNGSAIRIEGKELSILGEGRTICLKNGSITLGSNGVLNLGEEGYGNGLKIYSEDNTSSILYLNKNGELNMYGNVTLGPSRSGGQAGGVYVTGDSVFNMYGGLITDCVNWASISGGVSITGCAIFNMMGGKIQNCSGYEGGAVGINPNDPIGSDPSGEASFVMTGGEIVNCTDYYDGGGAFYVKTSKAVNVDIRGGTISGCYAQGNSEKNGGAIALRLSNSNSRVNISGVHIDGCSASRGGGLFIDSSATVNIGPNTVISNNTASADGGGVYINKGKAVFGEGVQISGNTASSGNGGGICKAVGTKATFGKIKVTGNSAGSEGGGIYLNGGPNDMDAVEIYDNSASQAGDDIALVYNQNSYVWLSEPGPGLKLSKCGHGIDGWYGDMAGERWKGCGSGELNIKPQDVSGPIMATINGGVYLKAAHGQVKEEPIVLQPMDMTIYMGGLAGNMLAVSPEGDFVKTDSLPVPGFTVKLPDQLKEATVENLLIKFQRDENTVLLWQFEEYGPGEHGVYRIVPRQGTDTSHLRMKFTDAKGNIVTDDSLDINTSINQTLEMAVYDEDVPADKLTVLYCNETDKDDPRNGNEYSLKLEKGKVFVRGVTANVDYGKLTDAVQADNPGLTAAPDTVYYINDTSIQTNNTEGIALLFDDIIEVNNTDKSNTELLTERANQELEKSGAIAAGTDMRYELKYLNLVDLNNGSAWLSAVTPVTIYWPLPEGTTKDTKFELLHFKGLHRNAGVDEVGGIIMDEKLEVENMTDGISVTDSHVIFQAGSTGFSPLALAWPAPKTTGGLTVSKTVSGVAGETNRAFNFSVTLDDGSISGTYGDMSFVNGVAEFSLKHGESKTADGLLEGITYSVTEVEANTEGYNTTSVGATGTVTAGTIAKAEFTNKRDSIPAVGTGGLKVTKTVKGNAGDTGRYFNFILVLDDRNISGPHGDMSFVNGVAEFSLKHGESKTADGLPEGINYSVTEIEANRRGYSTVVVNGSGSIQADSIIGVEFINTRNHFYSGLIPHTGDSSNLGLWIAMGGLSLLAIAGGGTFLWVRYRKSKSKENGKQP